MQRAIGRAKEGQWRISVGCLVLRCLAGLRLLGDQEPQAEGEEEEEVQEGEGSKIS